MLSGESRNYIQKANYFGLLVLVSQTICSYFSSFFQVGKSWGHAIAVPYSCGWLVGNCSIEEAQMQSQRPKR